MEHVTTKKDDTTPATGVAERAGAAAGTVAGSVAGSVGGAVSGARTRVGDLGDFLREQRQQARMSLRQLAEVAGVSNPYLSQVERGLRRPSAEVLQQIAKGLRISAEALYVRAGLLDEAGTGDVTAAVLSDPRLNERQKQVLLDVYTSFVTTHQEEQ
jgi:transcriptional regulator with XRE-family HTH domain